MKRRVRVISCPMQMGGNSRVNLPDTTSDKAVAHWQDWQKDLPSYTPAPTTDNFVGRPNSGDRRLPPVERMKTIQDSLQGVNFYNTRNPDYGGTPEITLQTGNFRGAHVPTGLIDDIYSASKKKGVDPWTMYGLAGQETTLGHNYYGPLGKTQAGSLSGWNVNESHEPKNPYLYLREHGAPGIQLYKDKSGVYANPSSVAGEDSLNKFMEQRPELVDSYRNSQSKRVLTQPTSPAELAIDYMNKRGGISSYNPGDPDYKNKINKRIEELKADPVMKKYMKGKGYMQMGGQLSPQEMDAYNAFHTKMYQQLGPNYGGDTYNHGQFNNPALENWNNQNPNQHIDLGRIQGAPGSLDPLGRSPQDFKVGPQTMSKSFMRYQTQNGSGPVIDYGTNRQAAQSVASSWAGRNMNTGWEGFGDPKSDINYKPPASSSLETWQSNDQNIPMTSVSRPQKSNYHTDENSDYSIDSVRSAKFGGMRSKKKVRITGTPMTGIGTDGPATTPDATMMDMGGYANQGATRGYGMQQPGSGFALNRRWNTPAGNPGTESQVQPFARVGNTLPESQDGGDITVEKKEKILGDFDQDGNQELMGVNVGTHASGNDVDVDVPQNSFVFSDTSDLKIKDPEILAQFGITTMKRGGFTPADIAKKYDLNKYKKVTADPNADHYALQTAQLMSDNYLAKLSKLAQIQEQMKKGMGMEHSADGVARDGGRYQSGGMTPYTGTKGTTMTKDQLEAGYKSLGWDGKSNAGEWMNTNYPDIVNQVIDEEAIPSDYSPNNPLGTKFYGLRYERALQKAMGTGKPMGLQLSHDDDFDQPVGPTVNPSPGLFNDNSSFIGPPDADYLHTGSPDSSSSLEKNKKGSGRRWNGVGIDPNFYGNLQGALGIANLRKFVPYEPVPQAVIPETTFLDPTRAIAAQQEEARSGSEMDAMSANPQAARAMGLARQGVAGAAAANIIGDYHNKNVQIANAGAQGAAGITNQLFEKQANRLAELNKGNFLSDRDYQKEMGRLQADFTGRMQKQHDNQVKTAWLNKTSPFFNINPVTQMPDFKPADAKARYEEMYRNTGEYSPDIQKKARDIYTKLEQDFPNVDKTKLFSQAIGMAGMREHSTTSFDAYGKSKGTRESGEYTGPQYKKGGPLMRMGGSTMDLYDNSKLKKFMK